MDNLSGQAIKGYELRDFDNAIPYVVMDLDFVIRIRSHVFTVWVLPVVAILLAHREEYEHAARILGLILNHPHAPRYNELDPLLIDLREDLEHELGSEQYEAAREQGRSLDLDVVAQELLAEFSPDHKGEDLARSPHLPHSLAANEALTEPLTQRQLEVLTLICSGLSNQEIADQLVVSMNTIKKHVNHLYSKLDVTSRSQAILLAQDLGLV